jgi:catechol 2,3-dioxygenase-like lactoylglutathione lyase family enzyme
MVRGVKGGHRGALDMAKPIPEGYHGVTAALTVKDGEEAIELYQKAFGAREIMRIPGPDGKPMHAEIRGDRFGAVEEFFASMAEK